MTFSTVLVDRELAAVREFDGGECAEFTPGQLHDVSDALGRARRCLDALVVMVAGEVGRRSAPELGVGGLSRREGFSTPQEMLAKTLGTSTFEAKRLIDVGKTLTADDGQGGDVLSGLEAPLQAGPEPEADGHGGHEQSGASAGELRTPVATPRAKYPYLAQAVASGSIGVEAAALATRTLNVLEPVFLVNAQREIAVTDDEVARRRARTQLHELERRLVDKSQRLSLAEFRRACNRERASTSPKDLVERERRQREARTLFLSEDADGMTVMTVKLDAASAAPVKAWVEAQVRFAFGQRRKMPKADGNHVVDEGLSDETDNGPWASLTPAERQQARAMSLSDERSAGQIRIDALVSLSLHGLDCDKPTSGVRTTVVLRMDVKDIENDLALGECDQLRGPISIGMLRAMAVDAQVIPMVCGGGSLPLDVGKLNRYFTHGQRIALVERDGGCSWCHAPPSFCEAHHIDWWAKHNGRTDIKNGATRQYTRMRPSIPESLSTEVRHSAILTCHGESRHQIPAGSRELHKSRV